MNTIILQIPLKEYGPIATLAAAAKMPLDKYVTEQVMQAKKEAILSEK